MFHHLVVFLGFHPGPPLEKIASSFLLNKRNDFLRTEIREEAILPFGHLMHWFLKASTLAVTRRTPLETLLYVTSNRSAISRVVSWFAI